MRRYKSILLLCCILFLTLQTVSAKTIRVLAIGNSFSEDAIEQNLYEIVDAAGDKIIIGNLYIPGCSLKRHYENSQTNANDYRYRKIGIDGKMREDGKCALKKALQDEKWDYISFQQASHFSGLYDTYEPYLSRLVEYVRDVVGKHPKFIWHQTWAYAQDSNHDGFKNYGHSQRQMYDAIIACSRKAVNDNRLFRVVPSGTAVQNVRTSFIGDTMNRDGYHLDLIHGRYTAACVWFEILFRKSVIGNAYTPEGMSLAYREVIQRAAHAAVKKPYEITPMR